MMTSGGLKRLGFVLEEMTFEPWFCPYISRKLVLVLLTGGFTVTRRSGISY